MKETYIDNAADLRALCRRFAGADWLTLDTEFIRETTYYPRLCLIQLADDETAACIDPLVINDLETLRELMMNPAVTKVLHAGSQDMEIFHHLWGEPPRPVFDTQPAAALAGLGDQIGYAKLVETLTGTRLAKGHSRTDWAQRPLDEAQIRYALDDVIHLRAVYRKLRRQLAEQGRLEWLRADFERLMSPQSYHIEPLDTWKRCKGWQRLKGVQLAALQQLAAWREETARARNRPRGRILKDDLLLEIARRMPRDPAQLGKLRGLDRGLLKQHGKTLIERIEAARRLPREQWPRPPERPDPPDAQQQARADLLQCLLRLKAAEHQISPTSLATRKELEAIAGGDLDRPLLQGWRGELVGDALRGLLDGRLRLAIGDDAKVRIEPR